MQNPVIILGAKHFGKAALDIFNSNNVVVYCFLDDDTTLQHSEINDVMVMSRSDDPEFMKLLGKKCEVFVATEESAERISLAEMLKEDYQVMPVNAIHKFSYVSENAWLGHGIMVNAGAVVNTNSRIGDGCIIHSNAVVETGAELGNYVQVGSGAIINADVTVGEGAFIGSGAMVVSGVKIGKNARVGAGAVVVADVKANQTVFGNPAQPVK